MIEIFIVLIGLVVQYFIVKYAVKNGVKEAYRDITGKKLPEDIKADMERKPDRKDK